MYGTNRDFLSLEDACQIWLQRWVVSLLENSIQFLLKYQTLECGGLHCTVHTHELYLFAWFWWAFLFVFWSFWLFKGRNGYHLKVMFLGISKAAVLCREETGKGHLKLFHCMGGTDSTCSSWQMEKNSLSLPPASLAEENGKFVLKV